MPKWDAKRVFEDFGCVLKPNSIYIDHKLTNPIEILCNALIYQCRHGREEDRGSFLEWVMDHAID